MTIEMTIMHDITVVMLPKRLDASNAPDIEYEIRANLTGQSKKLIFDFSETEYIASAGLRAILQITRDFIKNGGVAALVELRPTVYKVFDMAGFTSIFTICITRDEAIQKMK
ncbi:MAG: STAS domain-containing protein [Methanoregula sp.]|jgi:anti-anti-sigma factor|nr:STAS domain-containing protein [Methanoregula sp.]